MEDTFQIDEEEDSDREIRRKKLAFKEQVASARSHLDGQKSKYYKEIKAGSKLTPEQQKAMDFFNRYNKESEENQKIADAATSTFLKKTDQVFNDKFKGFEYNVGDKKYRFNVKNANEVKETQSDINNFVKKFLNKNNTMEDAKGYHKSLYTAMNADAIAKHFYEQGKADAMKNSVAKAKNVDMNPRQSHGKAKTSGMKMRVLGETASDFKFKIKNNK
jgi:ABC-type sulfate transport system substrate-binding protein